MVQIRDGMEEAKDSRQRFANGQSTQMVIGATETPDSQILTHGVPAVHELRPEACVLFRLQPDSVCRRSTAAQSRAAGSRASPLPG